jgi:hypothetical protein
VKRCPWYLMPGMRCQAHAGHAEGCVNDEPDVLAAKQYTGTLPDAETIADQSDPWLQYPWGSVVRVLEFIEALPAGSCEEDCHGGYFAPTSNGPTGDGIERCDTCNVFEGDLDAALALAATIGPDITVWYLTDNEESTDE